LFAENEVTIFSTASGHLQRSLKLQGLFTTMKD